MPKRVIKIGYKKRYRKKAKNLVRIRKNNDQQQILIKHFHKNPNWSKKAITRIAKETGLSETRVYKWNWDYKLKIRFEFQQ